MATNLQEQSAAGLSTVVPLGKSTAIADAAPTDETLVPCAVATDTGIPAAVSSASMTEEQQVKKLETSLARMLQWVAAAESRTTILVGLETAMFGALAAAANVPGQWAPWTIFCVAVAASLLLFSLASLAAASFPRVKGPLASVLFFGTVADQKAEEYCTAVRGLTISAYVDDLARQCHRNAEIANKKYFYIQRAMMLLFFSIAPWALAIGLSTRFLITI